jgi:hypothetical protein
MDSIFIKNILDRIFLFYFRFPDETENIQSAFSGNAHPLKFSKFKLPYHDTTTFHSVYPKKN